MTDTFALLYQGQPTNSAATLYTAPASTQVIVKHIRVVNPTAADHTIKLWQNGTTDSKLILPVTTVLAGGWGEFDGVILMSATDTISGQCDASTTITVEIYGDKIT